MLDAEAAMECEATGSGDRLIVIRVFLALARSVAKPI